LEEAGAEVELK